MKPTTALVAFALLVLAGQAADIPSPKSDPWRPVRAMIGKWEGDVQGQPGTGKAAREYRFTLNNRFIRVANRSEYPAQEKNPKGEIHNDEGFISYDRGAKKLVMRQFHVEGFVNHYVLDNVSEDGNTVVFTTVAIENIPAGFRGRETYRFVSADEFIETFAIAEPGKDFETYSETHFRRVK